MKNNKVVVVAASLVLMLVLYIVMGSDVFQSLGGEESIDQYVIHPSDTETSSVAIADDFVYAAFGRRIVVYEYSDGNLSYVGKTPIFSTIEEGSNSPVLDMSVYGEHLFVALSDWSTDQAIRFGWASGIQNASVDDGEMPGIMAFDIGNRANPQLISWTPIDTGGLDIDLHDDKLFVAAAAGGVKVYDVSVPGTVQEVSSIDIPGAMALDVSDGVLVVGQSGKQYSGIQNSAGGASSPTQDTGLDRLVVYSWYVDSSSTNAISIVKDGEISLEDTPVKVEMSNDGQMVALSTDNSVWFVDISDHQAPSIVSNVNMPNRIENIAIDDHAKLYVSQSNGNTIGESVVVRAIDISDIANPRLEETHQMVSGSNAIAIMGTNLIVAGVRGGISVLDIDAGLKTINQNNSTRMWYDDIVIKDNYAIISNYFHGIDIYDVTETSSPVSIGGIDLDAYSDRVGFHKRLAISDNILFVAGVEWLWMYDLSDINNPVLVDEPVRIGSSILYNVGDMVLDNEMLYITVSGDGVVFVDVSDVDNVNIVFRLPVIEAGRVAIHEDTLYAPCFDGVQMVDISTRTAPAKLGVVGPKALDDAVVIGSALLVSSAYGGVTSFDISNPRNPQLVGTSLNGSSIGDEVVFVEDMCVVGGGVVIASQYNEVVMCNIQQPASVECDTNDEGEIFGIGAAYDNGIVYIVHGDGLVVLDINNPIAPVELSSIDGPG